MRAEPGGPPDRIQGLRDSSRRAPGCSISPGRCERGSSPLPQRYRSQLAVVALSGCAASRHSRHQAYGQQVCWHTQQVLQSPPHCLLPCCSAGPALVATSPDSNFTSKLSAKALRLADSVRGVAECWWPSAAILPVLAGVASSNTLAAAPSLSSQVWAGVHGSSLAGAPQVLPAPHILLPFPLL